MKKLNIAIIGLGNIGCYLFKYLIDNKKILTEKIIAHLSLNMCLPKIKKRKEISKLKKING